MPSFYFPDLNDNITSLNLTGDEFHHLVHVLRQKPGAEIKLNSGKGWFGKGVIHSVEKTKAVIDVSDISFIEPYANPFAIAFSLLRSKNDEWLVEKTTELGVTDLFPFQSKYSVRNPSANTIPRFKLAAMSAIKQCDNPYLPEIHNSQNLENLLADISRKGYTPVTASEHMPDKWMNNLKHGTSYCFIVGPEGGFSTNEFEQMKQSGVIELSLSRLILRAETAAVAVAAQYSLFNR